jgi:phosphomannomutase
MTLITSISGIRGTIGGTTGDNLTPIDIVKFTSAYGQWIKEKNRDTKCTIVVGRDARISGPWVNQLVCNTLVALGLDVIDAGLSTTPTVEMAVTFEAAQGGIIITASHNPKQWNALKLLNEKGEFISGEAGNDILELAANTEKINFAEVNNAGTIRNKEFMDQHIEAILNLPLVDSKIIGKQHYKIAIDAVNSSGGLYIPALLNALGVEVIYPIYCEPTGEFPHNPEPLPAHLGKIIEEVKSNKADLGIVVDPDVDRLALVDENGELFGEEYTLVAVADYVLQENKGGNSVSNLSSTRALRDVTEKHGGKYEASAVGEVNVVNKMKETNAVIGGEGNGGIIYPELHYGRDALVGIALLLTHMAKSGLSAAKLRSQYPNYTISKNKIDLPENISVDEVLGKIIDKYKNEDVNTIDGVKIEFDEEWVHLRKSNTEPIIRIYAESQSDQKADVLAKKLIKDIGDIVR